MAGRAPQRPLPPTGSRPPAGVRFAVAAARFHEGISRKLVDGALGALARHGVGPEAVEVHWVPGSFELPLAALTLARTGRYAGVVCLGVVIRGSTPHFEHVCREAAAGIRQAALQTGVPVTFGVITALDEEQAWERAGGAVGDRGQEAALAALEMAAWIRGLGAGRTRRAPRAPRRR
jgi:6,7-dimethyl-8-ribityllumazine synthase